MEYPSDPVREEQQKFTAEVASKIDGYEQEGHVDRLIVCAAPQTLGDLSAMLSTATRAKTTTEISKDYSSLPTDKLISSVRSAMSN